MKKLTSMVSAAALVAGGLMFGSGQAVAGNVNGSFNFGAAQIGGTQTYSPFNIPFNNFTWTSVVASAAAGDYAPASPQSPMVNGQLLGSNTCVICTSQINFQTAPGLGQTPQSVAGMLFWSDSLGDNFAFNMTSWVISSLNPGITESIDSFGELLERPLGIGPFVSKGTAEAVYSFSQAGVGPATTINGNATFASGNNVIQTPEPATIALLGVGLAGLGALRRRRRS